jgi:alpha-tubulin suppressor-like RCC1 family protein
MRKQWGRAPTLVCGVAGVLLSGISCRGDDVSSPTSLDTPNEEFALASASPALTFYQVSGGGVHTCGVTLNHRLYCWGGGYLGNGTTGGSTAPVAVSTTLLFQQVSAASSHTCAVTTDYRAYCWGLNGDGAIGDGTQTDRLRPVPVSGGLRFYQVESGDEATCAVTYPDNRAYCWGYHAEGELGDGTFQPARRLTPSAVAGGLRFRQVSVGGGHYPYAGHSCGVTTSDEAFCWGRNNWGQLGNGSNGSPSYAPVRVVGGHRFRQISAGSDYTCAVTTANRAFCWGNGRAGQIGDGKTFLRFSPSAVAGGHAFERITTGEFHTCAESTTNRAFCWGSNQGGATGAVGDGTTTQRLTPVPVAGGLFFSQVSTGYTQSCGRTETGVAWCWGTNSRGQLGDGTMTTRLRPVRVIGPR